MKKLQEIEDMIRHYRPDLTEEEITNYAMQTYLKQIPHEEPNN
jgi:hypothetical protein